MDEAIRNAVVFGAVALGCGALAWWPRWGWLGASLLAAGAVVAALVLGILSLEPALWAAAWPLEPVLLCLGWAALGLGLRRLGGVGGYGPPLLGAFMGGAAFGALPVAVGLAPGQPPRQAARLVLAATAGGLCGPLGSAPLLLLGRPGLQLSLVPLVLVFASLALLPGGVGPVRPATGRAPRLLQLIAVPLWGMALFLSPGLALGAALLSVLGLVVWQRAALRPGLGWRGPVWFLALCLSVLLLVPAGALDFAVANVDDIRVAVGRMLDLGFGMDGLVVASLVGGPPLALAGALAASSDPGALDLDLRAALVGGAALGSTLPAMAIAGPEVLRSSIVRWVAVALLVFGWLALRAT
jgi:hypothetical protein